MAGPGWLRCAVHLSARTAPDSRAETLAELDLEVAGDAPTSSRSVSQAMILGGSPFMSEAGVVGLQDGLGGRGAAAGARRRFISYMLRSAASSSSSGSDQPEVCRDCSPTSDTSASSCFVALRDGAVDLGQHLARAAGVGVGHEHDELVAAVARHGIGLAAALGEQPGEIAAPAVAGHSGRAGR